MLKNKGVIEGRKKMLISSYIYIPVGDLEKAARWYEEILDLDGNKIEIWEDYEYDVR